jgi:hypothetical protein
MQATEDIPLLVETNKTIKTLIKYYHQHPPTSLRRRFDQNAPTARSPLMPPRVDRDAGRIAEELIAHLSDLPVTKVTVTLEVEAEIPTGAPDYVVRTVTENARTQKFRSQGFEKE